MLTAEVIFLSISIRAPARGATCFIGKRVACMLFQSALPRGERQYRKNNSGILGGFQSALPRGERHDVFVIFPSGTLDFNPRSREGSDLGHLPGDSDQPISIRAPARGATRCCCQIWYQMAISIRAPARGATGADLVCDIGCIFISIRAPARGATVHYLFWGDSGEFQSALPRGERLTSTN